MIKKHTVVLGICLALSTGAAWAQSILPPPSSAPTSLPPLPPNTILPTVNIPPLPRTIEAPPVVETPTAAFSMEEFEKMLNMEVDRINTALTSMSVTLLRTDNPQYKEYISSGLLKMTPEEYARHDYGMAGIVSTGGRRNGVQSNVCFVLVDADRSLGLWNNFVAPLQSVSHPQSGVAWLVAHEVGHCWDQMERTAQLNNRSNWRASEAPTFGVIPDAVSKTLGNTFSKEQFLQNSYQVYEQPAQQQYAERVADAFGTLWMLKLGADVRAVDLLKGVRSQVGQHRPHNTIPVFELAKQKQQQATQQQRPDALWGMARDIQRQVGVTPEAIAQAPAVNPFQYATNITPSAPSNGRRNSDIARWVVTAQGPVPLDRNGNVIPQNKNPNTQPRNFNNLPRFGN